MSRAVSLPLLERARIASPCSVPWDHMTAVGNGERIRHCGQCSLNVHNISDMTRDEAEDFLRSVVPGQRVCGTFYQRSDGTILTRDCPVGLRAARQRMARLVSRLAAAAALLITGGVLARSRSTPANGSQGGLASVQPFATLTQWVRAKAAPPPVNTRFAGEICIPPPPTPSTSGPGAAGGG